MAALVKKIVRASSMAAVSAAIAIAALYFFATGVETQRQSILSGDGVIVIRTMHSYLPGVFIGAIGVLLFALALLTFLYKEAVYKKMLIYFNWTCAIGIDSIFFVGMGIYYYWLDSALYHSDEQIGC